MTDGRTIVKSLLAALLLLPFLASCSWQDPLAIPASESSRPEHGASLSSDEAAKAVAVARGVIADEGATISSVSAIVRSGKVKDANTGNPCTSGRVIKIKLIGDFPHTVTLGHVVLLGDPKPDFTVRAVIVMTDARSGRPCLIGVQTAENGEVVPIPDSTILQVR